MLQSLPLIRSRSLSRQRGLSMMSMVIVAVIIGFFALMAMRAFPSINEFLTIKKAVNKIMKAGPTSAGEIRTAFEKQKEIEYSIQSISAKDLVITKENDKVVVSFAYDKEIELMKPVYLLIKYEGRSK